jgi:hypothetical protein
MQNGITDWIILGSWIRFRLYFKALWGCSVESVCARERDGGRLVDVRMCVCVCVGGGGVLWEVG